jgi:hypothetical protein
MCEGREQMANNNAALMPAIKPVLQSKLSHSLGVMDVALRQQA